MTDRIRYLFGFHAFPKCPLSQRQLVECQRLNLNEETIYQIGCDVAAGFTFDEALRITFGS